jgi:hypothetical protein
LKANKIRGHQKLLSSKHKPGLSRYFAWNVFDAVTL